MFFPPVSLLHSSNIVRENIISRENIKPSLPTPQNLRNYNVSLIDQLLDDSFWWPIILIFPGNNTKNPEEFISESTKILKQSLSKLLTRFYPLAGRSKDEFSVDCNDEGVPFTVAKIKSNLSGFIKKDDQKSYLSLLPAVQDSTGPLPGDPVVQVQVNYFDDGGMAIGFVFSHKVEDGWIMNSFIKSWSLYANYGENNTEPVCPNYIFKSLFPQNKATDRNSSSFSSSAVMKDTKNGKTIMRRYLFDSRAISTLKSKSGDNPRRLSKAEVVTAFLWKCFMEASKSTRKLSLLIQGTEIRGNAEPPFPENCFGNFWWLAGATSKYEKNNDQLGNLVRKMRDSVSVFDNDFITRMQGDDGLAGFNINVKNTSGLFPDDAEVMSVSGWYDFDIYNVDFGWGKPIWLYNCNMIGNDDPNAASRNAVWLNDTKKGDGIEAWVTFGEQYMNAFDHNQELLDLVTVDPNPFDICCS